MERLPQPLGLSAPAGVDVAACGAVQRVAGVAAPRLLDGAEGPGSNDGWRAASVIRLLVSNLVHVDAPLVGHAPGSVARPRGSLCAPFTVLPLSTHVGSYGGVWAVAYGPRVIIDREGPVPPYRQIADDLRRQIEDGTIPPGRRIPSMVELEQRYEVARDTLRKATQVLKDEGLVHTVQGMGIYVVDRSEPSRL